MRWQPPQHPVDALTTREKCMIYYSRVVDLAVASGLLDDDPETEVGHFAFSDYYRQGKELAAELQEALQEYRARYPAAAEGRTDSLDREFAGVASRFQTESPEERAQHLQIIGAARNVWPVGTAFTLTYPWDLDGVGHPVRFRSDLTDFMKRRVVEILKKAGKLRGPELFNEHGEPR